MIEFQNVSKIYKGGKVAVDERKRKNDDDADDQPND